MEYYALTPIEQLRSKELMVISELSATKYVLIHGINEYGRLRECSYTSIERFIDVYDKTFKLQSATIPPKYKLV